MVGDITKEVTTAQKITEIDSYKIIFFLLLKYFTSTNVPTGMVKLGAINARPIIPNRCLTLIINRFLLVNILFSFFDPNFSITLMTH